MEINLTISDADTPRVLTALAHRQGWQALINNPDRDPNEPISVTNPAEIANPETREQFVQRRVRDYLRSEVQRYERDVSIVMPVSIEATPPTPPTKE